jgi:hypothetical protein
MVNLSKENWKDSISSSKSYLSVYFCAHIIIVASTLTLITITYHCKILILVLKKVGKPSNKQRYN